MKTPITFKLLTLILLNFTANAFAADASYDPATKLLTIPQVVVNGATYSNVEVTLKEVEVLKADLNTEEGNGGFSLQCSSPSIAGRKYTVISCSITSKFKERVVRAFDSSLTLTDDKGNTYLPNVVRLTDKYYNDMTNRPIINPVLLIAPDETAYLSIFYNDVNGNATGVKSLNIKVKDILNNSEASYTFTDTPFVERPLLSYEIPRTN